MDFQGVDAGGGGVAGGATGHGHRRGRRLSDICRDRGVVGEGRNGGHV